MLLVSSENKMAIFFFVKKWIIQKIGTYLESLIIFRTKFSNLIILSGQKGFPRKTAASTTTLYSSPKSDSSTRCLIVCYWYDIKMQLRRTKLRLRVQWLVLVIWSKKTTTASLDQLFMWKWNLRTYLTCWTPACKENERFFTKNFVKLHE